MSKYKSIITLIDDTCNNRVSNFNAKAADYTDEAIRRQFADIMDLTEDGKMTPRQFRKHKDEIFEIIEEVLEIQIPNAWNTSPFYREFVDTVNVALGQKNVFTVPNTSTLVVNKFSGNHWDTFRQKLGGSQEFSIPTEWYQVRVYEEFENFMIGNMTLVEMFNKLMEAISKDFDNRISTAFYAADAYLPTEFKESGSFAKDTLLDIIDKVQIATGKNVVLAGSKPTLATLSSQGMDQYWIPESAKQERMTTGRVRVWEGYNTIEIPRTFLKGTYDFNITNKTIFVLPEGTKFIKAVFEGGTRQRFLDYTQTMDQTYDYEVQYKAGIGVVFEELFGSYTIV